MNQAKQKAIEYLEKNVPGSSCYDEGVHKAIDIALQEQEKKWLELFDVDSFEEVKSMIEIDGFKLIRVKEIFEWIKENCKHHCDNYKDECGLEDDEVIINIKELKEMMKK